MAWLTGFTGSAAQIAGPGRQGRRVQRRPLHRPARPAGRRAAVRAPPRHRASRPRSGWRPTCPRAAGSGFDPFLVKPRSSGTGWRRWWRPRAAPWSRSCAEPDRRGLDRPAGAARSAGSSSSTSATPARAAPPSGPGSATRSAGKKADWLLLTGANSIAWLLNIRGARHPLQPALPQLRPARGRRHLPLVRRPAQAAGRPRSRQRRDARAGRGLPRPPWTSSAGRAREVLVDPAEAHLGYLERLEAAGAKLVEADNPVAAGQGLQERGRDRRCRRRPAARRGRGRPLPRLAGRPAAGWQPSTRWARPSGSWPSAPRTRCSAARASPRSRRTGRNAALPHYRALPREQPAARPAARST